MMKNNPTPTITEVTCPTCRQTVPWSEQSPYRPFCSYRCRLIDLGDWADGRYRIPAVEDKQDQGEWG